MQFTLEEIHIISGEKNSSKLLYKTPTPPSYTLMHCGWEYSWA